MSDIDPTVFTLNHGVGQLARERGMLVPIPAIGALEPDPALAGAWISLDLSDPVYAIPPEPPDLHPLIYSGLRHVVSGPPEATKTLLAYKVVLEVLRADHEVAVVDFEMGPNAARILFDELGATLEELQRILFFSDVRGPPSEDTIAGFLIANVKLVLIDASAGAYDAAGLDENARKDVEQWAKQWIRPLWTNAIASLVLDHVTKNVEARGKFTIGSERKTGSADVHLGCEPVNPLRRGGSSLVKIRVHKDRRGFLERPFAMLVELSSDPVTHHITVTQRPPDHPTAAGVFLPTVLMEKVSRYLEGISEPVSRNNVQQQVKGKDQYLRQAIDALLVKEEFAAETVGPHGAHLIASVKPYRAPKETVAGVVVDEAEIERLVQKYDGELGG